MPEDISPSPIELKDVTQADLDALVEAKELAEAKLAAYENTLQTQLESARRDYAAAEEGYLVARSHLAELQRKVDLVTVKPVLENIKARS